TAAQWAQRHGLWFSTLSKAERGQRLAHSEPADGHAVKASPPHFEGSGKARRRPMTGAAVQRAVMASCLAQMLPNASELAAGRADDEVVHQLRVGLRRLRTALRELEALAPLGGPRFDPAWAPALQSVFRALGALRDEAVVRAAVEPALDTAGAPAAAVGTAAVVTGDKGDPGNPGEVVRSPAFQVALVGLIGFTAAVDAEGKTESTKKSDKAESADPRRSLGQRLSRLHRQVLHDGLRFEGLSPDARHRLRKRLKRLRDLTGFVGPLFGRKAAERYAEGLGRAQDALGLYQDRVVALAHYQKSSPDDPRAWFAVGWLTAQQPGVARAARKALARLERLDPFWK
ncbi:MAG: hypothetical protein JWQ88_1589, partial [Rhodoferax sp.]|nr:hypothetical protein [Rhodoferax sp.]